MAPPNRPVTLQDIANRTGYARSTVSLALRNHPSIPEATRERIRQAAEELHYRPNPLVAALMSQLRDQRCTHKEHLALICRFSQKLPHHRTTGAFYNTLYAAILDHAERQGLGVDEFYLGREDLSDQRLSRILISRNIHGVVFFPGSDDTRSEYPELDWDYFATVLIGYNTTRQNLHQVASNYTYDIDHAIQRVQAAGLQRIGFVVSESTNRSTDEAWLSRYLLDQFRRPASHRIPPHLPQSNEFSPADLLKWYHKYRPEVILIAGDKVATLLTEAGLSIPRDVRLINLVQRGEPGLAGIDPHTDEVGRATIGMLSSLLQSNRMGEPDFPQSIAIKGHWVPGASFPEGT